MLLSGGFSQEWLMSLLYSIPAIIIALCFHEFAHAWVANRLGDPTARLAGRMNIDPTRHLDIIGTISMVIFGFGWAKPVPINARNFKHPRRDEILVSVAGVIMNLIVAFVAYAVYVIALVNGVTNQIFYSLVSPIITLNVFLATFNILPIPPLDGFHIVSALCIRKHYKVVDFLYRFGFIILIVLLIFDVVSLVCGTLAQGILNLYNQFFMFLLG